MNTRIGRIFHGQPVARSGPVGGDICVLLFSSSSGECHWMLLILTDGDKGTRMHAVRDDDTNMWSYDTAPYKWKGSARLRVTLKIGSLNMTGMTVAKAVETCRSVTIPEGPSSGWDFSCMTWLRAALAQLDDAGFVTCPPENWENLRVELETLAYRHIAFYTTGHYISQWSC